MERRWIGRKELDWGCTVFDDARKIGHVTARNISRQGAMIDREQLELKVGNVVDLLCNVPFNQVHCIIRLQGQVVHFNAERVGLIWTDLVDGASLESSINASVKGEDKDSDSGSVGGQRQTGAESGTAASNFVRRT